jgi:hypothetical protein
LFYNNYDKLNHPKISFALVCFAVASLVLAAAIGVCCPAGSSGSFSPATAGHSPT